jgi:hypothetical protein
VGVPQVVQPDQRRGLLAQPRRGALCGNPEIRSARQRPTSRDGTLVDMPPGSADESAYGPGNLVDLDPGDVAAGRQITQAPVTDRVRLPARGRRARQLLRCRAPGRVLRGSAWLPFGLVPATV